MDACFVCTWCTCDHWQGLLASKEEGVVERVSGSRAEPLKALLRGDAGVHSLTVHPSGRISVNCPFRGVVLSGSFNPLHGVS